MKRVLIIKLGYSETLDNGLSLTTSLGDVLRTTVILHFLKRSSIAWLVDKKARPLLENNRYLDRIYDYCPSALKHLMGQKFDVIINFEKMPEVCRFSDSLTAKERFGFSFKGPSSCQSSNKRLLELSQDLDKKRKNNDYLQDILVETIGEKWDGESYILGYKPRSKVKYDIGFNWTTGNKWANKAWPKSYWKQLESLIKGKYSISWQKGLNSLYGYIDWMNSCRLVVTADSLGLHLGLTLKKKVVALFGPTSHKEIYFYGRGSFLLPDAPYNCMPCFKPFCDKRRQCLEYIFPQEVKKRIEDEFK